MTEDEFLDVARSNPINAALLERLPALGLPDGHLVAGCLFQAVWNRVSGQAPAWGVKDYDVFYFDDADLSWDAEDDVIRRVADMTRDLPGTIEVRNQARVHLWYSDHFGEDYPALRCARDGIDRYLVSCTCVGIAVSTGKLYAPDGLDDLTAGKLRMNPFNAIPRLFRQKAESYRARWPWLSIVE
jgi:hypothetical protein